MPRVLVVDDEPQLRHALVVNLQVRGYDVDTAATGREALDQAAAHHPDAVLLDLGMLGTDRGDVIRRLRGPPEAPTIVIVLAARDGEDDKVAAIDAGADDFVLKPFAIDDVLVRLSAALRGGANPDVVETEAFTLDLGRGEAWRAGTPVALSEDAWELVRLLVARPGRLLTGRYLAEHLGIAPDAGAAELRRRMTEIRAALEPDPSRPRYFVTEPGVGSRFEPTHDDHVTARGDDSWR
jgi:two-component system KDP operon response regulator KdpE